MNVLDETDEFSIMFAILKNENEFSKTFTKTFSMFTYTSQHHASSSTFQKETCENVS